MRFPPLAGWLSNHFRKTSLRQVLVELLVIQVFIAVGITGWLSFRNGQKAVSDLSTQLRAEVSDRVQQHLQNYLGHPHIITQSNINAAHLSELKLQDKIALERHFALQLQQFNSVSQIYYGRTDGSIVLTGFHESGKLLSGSTEDFPKRVFYLLNNLGQRVELLPEIQSNFDARIRPWYQAAITAKKPIWSPIYTFARGEIGITASQPSYDDSGNLRGVMGVDLVLGRIGDFLHGLKISPTGQLFILERSGLLVASSTGEKPYSINEQSQRAERLPAIDSSNHLTKATAKYLATNYQNLTQVENSQLLEFEIDGNRQFLQISPFQDHRGLNWLIITVIPEADFVCISRYYRSQAGRETFRGLQSGATEASGGKDPRV
jgi:Cache domain